MNVTISQSSFSRAVQTVVKAVSTNSTIPALGGILLSAEEGSITLTATDLEKSIRKTVPAYVEDGGAVVVPGKVMESIAKALPDEPIHIGLDGRICTLKCGKTSYRLSTIDAADFPEFPELGDGSSIELPVATLSDMVARTYKSASKDKSRPVLMGIKLSVDDDLVTLTATDSYRLVVADTNLPDSAGQFETVIPADSFKEALSFADPAGTVVISSGTNMTSFTFGTTTYMTRRIEGSFPNAKALVPNTHEMRAVVDIPAMRSALSRVSIFAKGGGSVRIDFADNQMMFTSADINNGEGSESVDVDVDGTMSVAVNAQYLADAIKAMGDADELYVELTKPVQPVILRSYGVVNVLYLLMPVRF